MIEKGKNMNEITMNVKHKPWSYAVRMTKAYVESKIEKIKNVYPFQDGIPTFRIGDMTSAFGHKVTNDIYAYGRHYHEDKMPGGHVDNYISSQIVYEYFANITASDSPVFWMPVGDNYGDLINIKYDAEGGYSKSYPIEVPYESHKESEILGLSTKRVMPKGYNLWCTKEEEEWAFEKLVAPIEYYDSYKYKSLESYFQEFLEIEDKIAEAEDEDLYD